MTSNHVRKARKPCRKPPARRPKGRPGCRPRPVPPVAVSVRRLLHSVACEEISLANLIAAEAKKTSKLAQQLDIPFSPREAIAHQKAVAAILRASACKERILLDKLRTVSVLLGRKKRR